MGGKRWTNGEEQIVRRWVPRIGYKKTAKKLADRGYKRTPVSIEYRAVRLGAHLGRPKDYWSISEFTYGGLAYITARKRAAQDGVLEKFVEASTKAPFVVPEWWALQYMREIESKHEAERSDWWTTKQVADHLGFDEHFVRNQYRRDSALRETRDAIRSIERRRGFGRKWLYNPEDVRRVAIQLRENSYDYAA